MRYSEAVKRHKFETKQRILKSILEAAETEKNASPSAGRRGYHYGTKDTDIETEARKKETITMRSTQINEVRSKKTGLIAAACAALLIGSGFATFARSGNIQTDDMKHSPVSAASTIETSSAAEQAPADTEEIVEKTEAAVTLADESSAVEEIVPGDEIKPQETIVSEPQVTLPENDTPVISGASSFNELYASSNTVYLGNVSSAESQYLEMPDGSKRYVIKYTLSGDFFRYDISSGDLYEYYNGEVVTLYQYAGEGTAPQFKTGETAMFMTAVTETALHEISGTTGVIYSDIADPNGAFGFSSNKLYSVSGANAGIVSGMFDYMLNVILPGKDSGSVSSWLVTLGGSVSETMVQRDDLPSYNTVEINWNDDYDLFEIVVNYNPKSDRVRELEEGGGYDITPDYGIVNEKVSGFEEMDIELREIVYYPDSTAVSLYLEAAPNQGYEVKPDVVYNLKHDFETSGLTNISDALNADATVIAEGYYNSYNGSIGFEIMFDQAGTDGSMEFDLEKEFTFTLTGISASDGSDISGEYRFTYKYNPLVATHDNVKIVTAATATNKY